MLVIARNCRYFNDDGEEAAAGEDDMGYQPAPGSPGQQSSSDSDSDDPLEAYMAGIEVLQHSEFLLKLSALEEHNFRQDQSCDVILL